MIRLHIKLRATIVAFFAVCITLLFFVKYNTCRSYIETWAGMLPVEVNYTCLILLFRCQLCLPSPGSQLQRRSDPFIRISPCEHCSSIHTHIFAQTQLDRALSSVDVVATDSHHRRGLCLDHFYDPNRPRQEHTHLRGEFSRHCCIQIG